MSMRVLLKGALAAIVFLVIALVAIPRFFAKRPGRVSRAKSDMRSLGTAIEAYFADYQAYPASVPMRELVSDYRQLEKAGGAYLAIVSPGNSAVAGITTPVAYLTQLFHDSFTYEFVSFAYYSDGKSWILFSPGPDNDYDIRRPEEVFTSTEDQPSTRMIVLAYDVTNGTVSSGDVWRVRQ